MSYIHFISAEIGARLSMQLDRLDHLHWDFEGLAHRANTARELARTARALLEALRLWYAEIEFAVRRSSARTSAMRAASLLARLTGRSLRQPEWVLGR